MASKNPPTYRITGLKLNYVPGTETTIYASWNAFKHKGFDKYEVKWKYTTGNNVWFEGSSSSIDSASTTTATYDPPANALKVTFTIDAISKDKDKKKNKYFKCKPESVTKDTKGAPRIQVPGTPEVEIHKSFLTEATYLSASISGYDNGVNLSTVTDIEFETVANDIVIYGSNVIAGITPGTGYAGMSLQVAEGSDYKVRCRALGVSNGVKIQSDWSAYSSNVSSGPGQVYGKPVIICLTENSVEVSWDMASHAYNYEVQYVPDNPDYFETSPDKIVSSKPDTENRSTTRIISDLDNTEGKTYYFRVRACGEGSDSNGRWSGISDPVVVGTAPEAPTTWSYTTSCKIEEGEVVILNWAHNSADGSKQTAAQVQIVINESDPIVIDIPDDQSSYEYDPSTLSDGDEVTWKVRTKGAVSYGGPDEDGWSEWSTARKFTAYIPPTVTWGLYDDVIWYWDYLDLDAGTTLTTDGDGEDLISTVTKFPFVLKADALPLTQTAISFSVSITSNSSYDALDETGSGKHVLAGDEVYQEFFTPNNNSMIKVFRPYDLDLEDGVTYTVTISASMDSGLGGEVVGTFDVAWEDILYAPNMEYTLDTDNYACYIRPFVVDEDDNEITNVYLNVYRREYDGRYTAVATDIDGELKLTVTDPHPALDYARYRVVAIDKTTGAVSFDDISAIEVGCNSIIIQWDELWTSFDNGAGPIDDREEMPVQGSMLRLPYNIDVSVDANPDVALVEYIGRGSPVSYYGTQRGESTRWNTEIPKSDKETLYAIRRLAAYMGDVYVREPSGIGYWANIKVSYNLQHSKMTIPITFSITRVEGGV